MKQVIVKMGPKSKGHKHKEYVLNVEPQEDRLPPPTFWAYCYRAWAFLNSIPARFNLFCFEFFWHIKVRSQLKKRAEREKQYLLTRAILSANTTSEEAAHDVVLSEHQVAGSAEFATAQAQLRDK